MNDEIVSLILQVDFKTAYDMFCTNVPNFSEEKLDMTQKQIQELTNKIKEGINVKFNIYYFLNNEFYEKPSTGIVRICGKSIPYIEFFEEIAQRKALVKNMLLSYYSYKRKPVISR